MVDGSTRTAGYLPKLHQELQAADPSLYATLAEASNGSIATLSPDGTLQQHRSLTDLLLELRHRPQTPTGTTTASSSTSSSSSSRSSLPGFRQLVAYETGFTALTPVTGDIYTWGDERYPACLGRDVSGEEGAEDDDDDAQPGSAAADRPAVVPALQDLPTGPVCKVAAGGYVLAALTAGNDLYLWGGGGGGGGGHPGGRRGAVLAGVGPEPAPVDLDGRDIADVAVGGSHLVVLTTGGDVFVTGDNGNGQLGLPTGDGPVGSGWTRVGLDLRGGRRAVGVAAGPRSSFILVQKGAT